MTTIIIRPAQPEDIDSIYAIFSTTDRDHRLSHPEIFQSLTTVQTAKKYYLESILSPEKALIIADVCDEIVGAILCSINTVPDIPIFVPRQYGCVENITIHKDFQGKGIGKRLMAEAQLWAQEQGATMMELSVWEFNQGALDFYRKLGYHTARRRMFLDL